MKPDSFLDRLFLVLGRQAPAYRWQVSPTGPWIVVAATIGRGLSPARSTESTSARRGAPPDQVEKPRTPGRWLPACAAALAIALVIVISFGGLFRWQQPTPLAEKEAALSRYLAEQSAFTYTNSSDFELASLLAVAAYHFSRTPEATSQLERAAATYLSVKDVNSVAFIPGGTTLAIGSNDGIVQLWDTTPGKTRLTWAIRTHGVTSVASSGNGQTLAIGSYDGTVRLWDVRRGTARRTLTGHTSGATSVAFSPDGRTLAIGSYDGTVRLWDVGNGTARRTLTGYVSGFTSVAFSPDGRTLAIGSYDGTMRLWDVRNGSGSINRTGHPAGVTPVAFNPDGQTLAIGGNDGTVRVWEFGHGDGKRIQTGHTSGVTSVAFSPDGRTLAIGTNDGTVRVRNQATGTSKVLRTGHIAGVSSVAFSSDGKTLATSSDDGTLLWDTMDRQPRPLQGGKLSNPAAAINVICRGVTRDLSSQEWSTYLPGQEPVALCPA